MQKCCIPYIPCRSLLLSTNVLNDYAAICGYYKSHIQAYGYSKNVVACKKPYIMQFSDNLPVEVNIMILCTTE